MHPNKKPRTQNYVGNDPNKTNPFPFADQVQDKDKISEVRTAIGKITGENISSKLPGPLPHTLTRASLPTVLNNEYWVCEKSDGLRVMMYCDNSGSYLVDRCFDIYKIRDKTGVYSMLGTSGATLVDGELVVNYFDKEHDTFANAKEACENFTSVEEFEKAQKVKKYILCVFDTMQINGSPCTSKPLLKRLGGVSFVKQTVLQEAQKRSIDQSALPMRVESKMFVRAVDVAQLVPYMHKLGDTDYVHFNKQKGIKSLNDGLIFTPQNNDYLHRQDVEVPIYKFKWPGLHTVDFLVQQPLTDVQGRVKLITEANRADSESGRAVSIVFTTATLEPKDMVRLQHLLGRRQTGIVEFAFDAAHGRWRPKLLRQDKTRPNFITTVSNCLEAMADGLSFDEVVRALRATKVSHQA